jgi:hypothetical protein
VTPAFEDRMWHPVETAWADLAGKLGLSIFPLNHTTFEADETGEVMARCGCARGFLCSAVGKHPKYKGYLTSGTKGDREARMLVLADWRNGFGVLTGTASGVVVIDCDPRNFDETSREDVLARLTGLPPTLTVTSGAEGGRHYYFRLPPGRVAVNSNTGVLLGPGVDIKGESQMVVWPPSFHSSGRCYGLDPTCPVDIASLPDDLVPILTAEPSPPPKPEVALRALASGEPVLVARDAFDRALERVGRNQEERNNALNMTAWALGQLVGCRLLDADEVARRLVEAAMRPDFPFEEARKTTFSGLFNGALLISQGQAEIVARLREESR